MDLTPSNQNTALSDGDCARLRRLARLLDICVTGSPDGGMVLSSPTLVTPVNIADWHRGHRRLLAEVCERLIPWVTFRLGEPCSRTLLSLSDPRLARVAELYRLWRDCPNDPAKAHARLDYRTVAAGTDRVQPPV